MFDPIIPLKEITSMLNDGRRFTVHRDGRVEGIEAIVERLPGDVVRVVPLDDADQCKDFDFPASEARAVAALKRFNDLMK